jgi:lysophospholipase L1-like esterase
MRRCGKRCIVAVALFLALPFAIEGVYRAGLFVAQRSAAPAVPVFDLIGAGESTMNGFPFEPHVSIPKLVAKMLGGQVDGRPIVVSNLARDGHPIFAQAAILAQSVACRDAKNPGAVIIYAGHNEGDLRGGSDAPGAWRPGLFERLARHSFVLRALQLQLVTMRFIRRPRGALAYEYFLERAIETARAAGLVPIVATVAGNVSGVEPNLDSVDTYQVEQAMATVQEQEDRGDCAAIEESCISEAKAGHRLAPLLCYRAGKCHQAAGDIARAGDLYQQALDLDPRTVFGRATRAQNAVVRRLAAAHEIPVADAVTLMAQVSPSGLLGNDVFGDGQHPNLEGMLLIARAYADAIAAAFSTTAPRRLLTPWEARAELGITPQVEARSHVLSASWLIASAAHHPWPHDRLRLAEQHLRSALDVAPDDFTAWFDLAVVQAAGRGFLREADTLEKLGKWSVFYRPAACVPDEDIAPMIERFRSLGIEEKILAAIEKNRAGACAGDDRAHTREP